MRYPVLMINPFKDRATERFFPRAPSLRLPESIRPAALRKSRMIHNVVVSQRKNHPDFKRFLFIHCLLQSST